MNNIESILVKLNKSKFRASFHLKKNDIEYIKEKGWHVILEHCRDFVVKRLAPAIIDNDGKQTPTHGHPVFIAQHACACCCRNCLNKWHNIKKGKELTNYEINYIVELLITWIHKEFENFKETTNKKLTKSFIKKTKKNAPIQLNLFD